MLNREQKVKELMDGFQCLKRYGTFRSVESAHLPRITPSQWGVLMFIEETGETTVKGVAGTLGISSSAATQLVDGLVENGYVVRKVNKADRRTVLLVLSKSTQTRVAKMKKQVLRKFLDFFEVLNDKEFNQYLLLNRKIVERFSKK